MPKADPPVAEKSSGTRGYVPLLGGVREAGGGAEGGRRRLLQVVRMKHYISMIAEGKGQP